MNQEENCSRKIEVLPIIPIMTKKVHSKLKKKTFFGNGLLINIYLPRESKSEKSSNSKSIILGEVRVPALQNGGSQCWEGGGAPAYQPSYPPSQPPPGSTPAPGQDPAAPASGPPPEKQDQMSKKPTRRPGVKPPPDRAKRSIYCFSLKNPIRQLFIKVRRR